MPEIDLTEEERLVLADILRRALADLHTEISHTDSGDFRDALKARRAVVEKVLASIGGATPGAPPLRTG
jgi:hypothetical protein